MSEKIILEIAVVGIDIGKNAFHVITLRPYPAGLIIATKGGMRKTGPSSATSGYGDDARNKAFAVTGEKALVSIGDIAVREKIAILAGYTERAGDRFYNAALLVDAEGRRQVNYRKMHLWGSYERAIFSPGNLSPVVDLAPGLKAGLLVCFDLDHAVTVQDLARRGADIVLEISATSAPYSVVPMAQVPTRAYDNAVFVAFCNHAGEHGGLRFAGLSTIAAPDGSILVRARPDCAELVIADIDTATYEAYRQHHRYSEQLRRDLFPCRDSSLARSL